MRRSTYYDPARRCLRRQSQWDGIVMTIVFPAHEALGDRLFRSFLTASPSNDLLQLAQCPLQSVLGEGYRGRPGTSVLAFCKNRKHHNGPPLSTGALLYARSWAELV